METNNCIIIIKGFGYYDGPNEKYPDMFNISAFILGAKTGKKYPREEAEKIKKRLERAGYDVVIEVRFYAVDAVGAWNKAMR